MNPETCDGWIGAVFPLARRPFGRLTEGMQGLPVLPRRRQAPGSREGSPFMLHVTCDLCGKELQSGEEHRYVVKIEVFAAHDPAEITEADLDDDHLEAVSELIRDMEDNLADPDDPEPACQNFRYDLCPECRKKFLRDPLGKDAAQKFDFSNN